MLAEGSAWGVRHGTHCKWHCSLTGNWALLVSKCICLYVISACMTHGFTCLHVCKCYFKYVSTHACAKAWRVSFGHKKLTEALLRLTTPLTSPRYTNLERTHRRHNGSQARLESHDHPHSIPNFFEWEVCGVQTCCMTSNLVGSWIAIRSWQNHTEVTPAHTRTYQQSTAGFHLAPQVGFAGLLLLVEREPYLPMTGLDSWLGNLRWSLHTVTWHGMFFVFFVILPILSYFVWIKRCTSSACVMHPH